MNPYIFWELSLNGTGDMHFIPKKEFINLFNSTIMNLRDLPVFNTTSDIAHCTKFLISRVHNRSLWWDKCYPIHAQDIQ
jgi:hypothetical protein